MNRLFFLLLCLLFVTKTNAQIHELGIFVGGSNFIGDVGATTYIKPNSPAIGLLYKWNKTPRHSWRFSYIQSKLTAKDIESDDPSRQLRNYEFENTVKEISAGLPIPTSRDPIVLPALVNVLKAPYILRVPDADSVIPVTKVILPAA